MINYIKQALSSDYSMQIAHRLSERKRSVSAGPVLSRFLKFIGFGLLMLLVAVSMYFLSRSGAVQQLNTQRLVTFVALSGLGLFGMSIVASFTLLWDTVITLYARSVAAENSLIESAFDETLDETQEIEVLDVPDDTSSVEDTEPSFDTDVTPVYVKVIPVRRTQSPKRNHDRTSSRKIGRRKMVLNFGAFVNPNAAKAESEQDSTVATRKVFIRHRDGSIKEIRSPRHSPSVSVNVPILDGSSYSEKEFTESVQTFLETIGSNFDLSNIPIDQRKQILKSIMQLKSVSKNYPGSAGSFVWSLLKESDEELEAKMSRTTGLAH